MFDLIQDLVALLGLIAAAVGACGIAFVIAKQLGLDAHFLRSLHPSSRTPERTLELMVRCADVASREGLLRLETHIAESGEPLLARGMALAMEGRPEREMRQELDRAVEASALKGEARARALSVAALTAQIAGIALALGLLVGCIALASGLSGSISGIVLLLGGTVGLLAMIAGSMWADTAANVRTADALSDMIIAEGVLLIRAGRDPAAITRTLGRYLQPTQTPPAQLARAA